MLGALIVATSFEVTITATGGPDGTQNFDLSFEVPHVSGEDTLLRRIERICSDAFSKREWVCRSGDLCTRYVKADLPLLDLSSKAGLDSVLGIGIALIALALLLMCIMAIILIRMRKKTNKKRGKKGYVPAFQPSPQYDADLYQAMRQHCNACFGSCQGPSSADIAQLKLCVDLLSNGR